MKLKKIFAGMAASAIAMTTFAMTATEASALDTAGNAGVAFQTHETWNYRDAYGTDGEAVFPAAIVGVQGGAYGFDTSVSCGDTTIQYDGTYTVSIATSGTINEKTDEDGWFINEEKTLTREGSAWSMIKNTEPATSEDSDADASSLTQDQVEWTDGKVTDVFNMLLVTTDIPCEYNDDDKPEIDGTEIKVTDLKVDMAGTEYTSNDVMFKSDAETLTIAVINAYGDSSIDASAIPTSDGTISITFTVSGLGEDPNANSSTADTSSSSGSTSSSSSTSKSSTTKSSTTSTSTTTSTTSDDTANAEAGASAGIALALAAVAGAAIVVSRRK
jgi:hypothetical protein